MSGEHQDAATEPIGSVLNRYAAQQIAGLQHAYLRGDPGARSRLAQLRRCDPVDDEQLLQAWEAAFEDPPVALIGAGDAPSMPERALVSALHLYAVHQQSKSARMHVGGVGLGAAIKRLANPGDAASQEKPVMRRYHALSTATEFGEAMHHLRGLVSRFRAEDIPLDYARLATDLFFLSMPATRTSVRLAWARDLVRPARAKNPSDPEAGDPASHGEAGETEPASLAET